jgi:diguanylate cyclase (GGDEF)-like protein
LVAAPVVWIAVSESATRMSALPLCLVGLSVLSLMVVRLAGRAGWLAVFHRADRVDGLTGLLGRRGFLDAARVALDGAPARTGHQPARPASAGVAMLFIDLDRFRDVNESLGHDEGDRLLRVVGHRMESTLRTGDRLARLGGDEFGVLLDDADLERATSVARRLRESLALPVTLAGVPVQASASVGVARAPEHGRTVADLLRRAEEAMYEAKRQRSGQRVFDPDCHRVSRDGLRLRSELRPALDDGQLELRYQPKADLHTGQVTGVEALVRWRHPVDGFRSPADFLPEMERSGLMPELTDRVLHLALADCASWHQAGTPLRVSVNVPAAVVVDPGLVEQVGQALSRYGLPPEALTVEVTEDSLITLPAAARRTMSGLRERGVKVSLDDFGSGFCSLAYLRELPADELKLDRSFLVGIDRAGPSAEIVRSAVTLAHALGMTIVAEGVESARAWSALSAWGCDEAQGYFVSPPLAGDAVVGWLEEWRCRLRRVPESETGESVLNVLAPICAHHGRRALWSVGFRMSQRPDIEGRRLSSNRASAAGRLASGY